MAFTLSGITEGFSGYREELPAVFAGGESELQHAVGFVVADFAVGLGVAERGVATAARADDKLADAVVGVGIAFRILRGEAFVGMFVAGEDDVCVGVVEILPEGAQFGMLGVFWEEAAAEESVVAVG